MIYRLGTGSILQIHGKDRCKVLNNLATQDLRTLCDGQSLETFVTEPKGKVFGHGMVVGLGQTVWFVTVPGQSERLLKHLDRYIIMEDAQVIDVSHQYSFWLCDDPVGFAGSMDRSPAKETSIVLPIEGQDVIAFWAPWIAEDSHLVLVPAPIETMFREKVASLGVIESDFVCRGEWEARRIDQFWPWFGQDMDDKNLPQELDRDAHAISFTKGCYLGQETIARLDALGQVQKKLVRLLLSGRVLPFLSEPAETILRAGDTEVGSLRSVAKRPNGELVGLAYVKRSHFSVGTELTLGSQGTTVKII
jgi:tRNA-modifying protein YgfZ